MKDYKALSFRYLKMNKKRTAITVVGVSVAVFVLFVMLNLGWSALLHFREKTREENNYEIVLFTEESEQIEKIIADPRVKEARVGSYYHKWYDDELEDTVEKVYSNALYIDTSNPYQMLSIMEELKSDYNVEGYYNGDLAYSYFNDNIANGIFIGVMFLLLVSYIFAIFGVGIIRNSIQLSTMEQIKDYGNMRCIGASKSQLKTFIYIEGAIMELSGMAIGIILGTIVSMIVGHFLGFAAGFHFLPVLFVAVAFLGDLYFAMQENCKVIAHMTPIDAVRGEYRIRKEKIKARKSGIFGKVFGVEGDYAYKNIMRSPGRFLKTILAIGIGIAALIAGGTVAESIGSSIKEVSDKYKYYQLYYQIDGTYDTDQELIKASLPPMEQMEALKEKSCITEIKRIYAFQNYISNENIVEHFTDEYLETLQGNGFWEFYNNVINNKNLDEEWRQSLMQYFKQIDCYGYAKEDIDRYKSVLVAGTLDVSDRGIVLVNGGRCEKLPEDSDTLGIEYINVTYTDYQVGDEIKFVDVIKLKQMVQTRFEQAKADLTSDENWDDIKDKIKNECFNELLKEGCTVTYTIEGIVSDDVNHECNEPRFVMPLSNYFELTGADESQMNGIQYHVEKYPFGNSLSKSYFYQDDIYDETDKTLYVDSSLYVSDMDSLNQIKYVLLIGELFALFIVSMSSANIINTSASNLYLRRREFAQLRVIGVSKKRLIKMVTLEGVITAIVANLVGVVVGGGIGYLLFWFIHMITGISYRFPVIFLLLGIFLSMFLLLGSIYFPLMGLKQDMVADLAGSGE